MNWTKLEDWLGCAIRQDKQTQKKPCGFQSSLDVTDWTTLCYLPITCCIRSTEYSWHDAPLPPGICLPCLAGHLTLLSLRLCCHGNSSVTGPGWAWGMSSGEMARFLQWREEGGGMLWGGWLKRGRNGWWKAERALTWKRRSRSIYSLSASRHVVIVLFSWPQISWTIYLCWE